MQDENKGKNAELIQHFLKRCSMDTAFCAAFKKADNPNTEFYSWEYLSQFGVDLSKSWERLPMVTVFSATARSKQQHDGHLSIGTAIARCYDSSPGKHDGNKSDPAKVRMRRVLACSTVEELCMVIHPLLRLMQSRGVTVSYAKLLTDLRLFYYNADRVRTTWAQDFYSNQYKMEDKS